MPLPMVHLAVAHALKDEPFTGADKAAYYLGANAPDSIHKREGWTRADKDRSHLRDALPSQPGYEERIRRALALMEHTCGVPASDSFRAGYAVHLLTDIEWVRSFYTPCYLTRYRDDASPCLDVKAAYYNDTDLADRHLYLISPWRPEVFALLSSIRGQAFEGLVFASEVEAWRDHILRFYDAMDLERYVSARYILPQDIDRFIERACRFIRAKLADISLL